MMNRHMKRRLHALGAFAAMITLSAQMATAAITTDSVIASYQAEGYTRVEVRVGVSQMKVEAIKGNQKVETIYDIATGAVLKTETETVRAGENTAPGVSVRERNRDFVRVAGSDDDNDDIGDDDSRDDDDDSNDDHGGDRDDDSNDDDDDSNDDHGGDRDDDSNDDDDDRDDDHGGGNDDDGDDDHGSDHD